MDEVKKEEEPPLLLLLLLLRSRCVCVGRREAFFVVVWLCVEMIRRAAN